MLPGTSFGDDSEFSHFFSKKGLPDCVINFVRTGMAKIFPFEEDLSAVYGRR